MAMEEIKHILYTTEMVYCEQMVNWEQVIDWLSQQHVNWNQRRFMIACPWHLHCARRQSTDWVEQREKHRKKKSKETKIVSRMGRALTIGIDRKIKSEKPVKYM